MRILFVAEDPDLVGGIPRYALPLARALSRRGIDVHYLWSGGFSRQYDFRIKRYWRREDRDGIPSYGLINAKHVGVSFGSPMQDVTGSDSRSILRLVRKLNPDVIHIHSLLGIPSAILDELSSIAPIILSVHEFGIVCQRRVLVQRDGTVCGSYATQRDCPTCVDPLALERYRWRNRLRRSRIGSGLIYKTRLSALARAVFDKRERAIHTPAKDSQHDPSSGYRWRLTENISHVNSSVSAVLAVSTHVADVLAEVGVDPQVIEVLHIGSPSASALSPMPLPSRTTGKVGVGCFGGIVPNKGVHILIDALTMMAEPPPTIVGGLGESEYARDLMRRAPPSTKFVGGYTQAMLADLLAQVDLVVAPSTGPDTSPQTLLEGLAAGRPVVASRIGGIPDFVHDGVNGRLFGAGSAHELMKILGTLRDTKAVWNLAAGVQRPKSLETHVTELVDRYHDITLGH